MSTTSRPTSSADWPRRGQRRRIRPLLEAWLLEVAAAVGRLHPEPHGAAVAHDLDGDLGSRRTAAPHLAVKVGQAVDAHVADARDDVAAPHAGGGGRSLLAQAGDQDAAVAFGGIDPEPRPGRLVHLAV